MGSRSALPRPPRPRFVAPGSELAPFSMPLGFTSGRRFTPLRVATSARSSATAPRSPPPARLRSAFSASSRSASASSSARGRPARVIFAEADMAGTLFSGSGVLSSCDQGRHQLAEEGFAPAAGVVHELEEAQVQRQLFLRDAAVRPKPGAQQRPEALHRVDVHLAEAIAVLVARILA